MLTVALLAAASAAVGCDRNCPEAAPVESGEYTVVERILADDDPSDDWTQTIAPDALLSVDRASNTATLVYERDGTTYQVQFTLEH